MRRAYEPSGDQIGYAELLPRTSQPDPAIGEGCEFGMDGGGLFGVRDGAGLSGSADGEVDGAGLKDGAGDVGDVSGTGGSDPPAVGVGRIVGWTVGAAVGVAAVHATATKHTTRNSRCATVLHPYLPSLRRR